MSTGTASIDLHSRAGRIPGSEEAPIADPFYLASAFRRRMNQVERLEELGVSLFSSGPPGLMPEAPREGLEKLGNELISKF